MGGFAAGIAQGLEQSQDRQMQAAQLKLQQDFAKHQQKAMETEDQMKQMQLQSLLKKMAYQEQMPAEMAAISGSQAGPLGAGMEGPAAPQEINRSHLASFLQSASMNGQDPNQLLELMSISDPRIGAIKESLRPPDLRILPADSTLVQVGGKSQPQQAPAAQPTLPTPVEDPGKKYQANLEREQALDVGRKTGVGETEIDYQALAARNPPPADWGTGGIPQPQAQAPAPAPAPQPAGPQVQVLAQGKPKASETKPMNVAPGSSVWDPVTGKVLYNNPTAPGKPNDFGDRAESAAAIYMKNKYDIDGGTFTQLIAIDPIAAKKVRDQTFVEEPATIAAGKMAATIPEKQNEVLAPTEAHDLGVPYGTTRKEAMGIMPLTAIEREALASFDTGRLLIQDIKTYSDKINTAPGGVGGRLEQGKKLWGAMTQSNPDAALLQSKAGELARLARTMGEKGALAEGDVARTAALVPSVLDTKEVAQQKLKDLSALITGAETAFNKSKGIKRPKGHAPDFEPATPKDTTEAQIPVPPNLSKKQQEIFKQEYLKQRQKVQGEMQKGSTNAQQVK